MTEYVKAMSAFFDTCCDSTVNQATLGDYKLQKTIEQAFDGWQIIKEIV